MADSSSRKKTPVVIDAHGHVKWYGYDAKRLVANMDEHGIDVMWLLSWEAPPHEIDGYSDSVFWPGQECLPLKDVVEAASEYPTRFVPFFAPDPRRRGFLARLQGAMKHHGVRGCGELKVRLMLDQPEALELFHFCGENKLPVIFHMDVPLPRHDLSKDPGYWYCCDWEHLARALERCPKTTFLGHAPGFWREVSGDADRSAEGYPKGPVTPGGRLWAYLDKYPNLWCDLSAGSALNAISRDPAVGRRFLLRYQDRCLFARDYFDGRLHAFIRQCKLPADVYRKIMGENALRLVPS